MSEVLVTTHPAGSLVDVDANTLLRLGSYSDGNVHSQAHFYEARITGTKLSRTDFDALYDTLTAKWSVFPCGDNQTGQWVWESDYVLGFTRFIGSQETTSSNFTNLNNGEWITRWSCNDQRLSFVRQNVDSYMGFHSDNNTKLTNVFFAGSIACVSGFPWPWGDATTLVVYGWIGSAGYLLCRGNSGTMQPGDWWLSTTVSGGQTANASSTLRLCFADGNQQTVSTSGFGYWGGLLAVQVVQATATTVEVAIVADRQVAPIMQHATQRYM